MFGLIFLLFIFALILLGKENCSTGYSDVLCLQVNIIIDYDNMFEISVMINISHLGHIIVRLVQSNENRNNLKIKIVHHG